MFNKLYHILVCLHVDCRVEEYECQYITDGDEGAKEFVETTFVDGDPHTSYCVTYIGECDAVDEETWIPMEPEVYAGCHGNTCNAYWFDEDDQVE